MSSRDSRNRPTAEEVAGRLVILKHIIVFAGSAIPDGLLRKYFDGWSMDDREDFVQKVEKQRDQFWQRLRDEALWEQMSRREREFAGKTIITLTAQERVDGTWRLEAAQILMWALGRVPHIPPYDTPADRNLAKQMPSTLTTDSPWRLRAESEIGEARDLAEMWHWRSRTRQLIERGDNLLADARLAEKLQQSGLRSYDDIVRVCAAKAAAEGAIGQCIDDDFAAKGKAYRDLDELEWPQVRSITMERHFALNWLCGLAPGNRWDETPTDT